MCNPLAPAVCLLLAVASELSVSVSYEPVHLPKPQPHKLPRLARFAPEPWGTFLLITGSPLSAPALRIVSSQSVILCPHNAWHILNACLLS